DLPWNPMRIEQRIGRIDRRGQQSDVVNIYNMITSDTIDAEIYHRCLLRIGIFEDSVGECSEILGEISRAIQNIVFDTSLTEDERKIKLEQIADNEVRKVQELRRLEEDEKQLLGFNLSNYTMTKEVQEAENPWISPDAIKYMLEKYLESRIGVGNYVLGESPLKTLRLSAEARKLLLDDFRKLPITRSAIRRSWELYLKSSKPNCAITFTSECAEQNRQAFFITIVHPLAKQAAEYFDIGDVFYVGAAINSTEFKSGEYPFSIYAWEYFGYKPQRKLVAVCEDNNVQCELMEILQMAAIVPMETEQYHSVWGALEANHLQLWDAAKTEHKREAEASCRYKAESLTNNFNSRERILQQQIADAYDENILRMRRAELENAKTKYNARVAELQQEAAKADIHIRLLVNGVLFVEED
ncbi:MAG TPA: ATP-dependent helicase, partial [Firmicutes bacterium]|nr:ATP-dependent helicase [Bacillota bacterium]